MLTVIKKLNYRRYFFAVFIILLAGFIAYGISLSNNFLMDDHSLIEDNYLIRDISTVYRVFLHPYLETYYRPIVTYSFAADYYFWQLNPPGYHLTNIIIHSFTASLFFYLLYLLFRDFEVSLIAGLLFAIHPINSLTVNYISDRGNILAAFFMLTALVVFYYGYESNSLKSYFLGFLSLALALLCRESAILFPFYLLCMLLVPGERGGNKKIFILFILTLLTVGIYLLLRLSYLDLAVLELPGSIRFFSLDSLRSFFYIIARYISLVLFPYNICFFLTVPQAIPVYQTILHIALLILCFAIVPFKFRKNPIFLFSSAWFLIGIMPLYRLMFMRPRDGFIMQDSWIYFSSIGLFLILSACLTYIRKILKVKYFYAILTVLLLLCAGKTATDSSLWSNDKRYCLYWLKLVPGNPLANFYLARYYQKNKDYQKAIDYYRKALVYSKTGRDEVFIINSRTSAILNNLGISFYKQGDGEDAEKYFELALKSDPDNPTPHFNLGTICLKRGDRAGAVYHYNQVTRIKPDHFMAHYNLAVIYANLGDEAKALQEARIASSLNPGCFEKNGLIESEPEEGLSRQNL